MLPDVSKGRAAFVFSIVESVNLLITVRMNAVRFIEIDEEMEMMGINYFTPLSKVHWRSANFNPLTPNDHYSGRTAPLTSKRCILYIYSTNIGTEYFKHGIYFSSFPLQNAVCFILLTYLVHVLFILYIQGVLRLKK